MSLLEISNLSVDFPNRHGTFAAVKSASLSVERGEILGVVGESGAGKSTIGNAIVGLLQSPGRIAGGKIVLDQLRIDDKNKDVIRQIRGRRVGMIFQDPMTSLNPIETIEFQLVETIQHHLQLGADAARQRAVELLQIVGIPRPEERILQYPHQFSGGMRQRVVIALALCADPELIIADEPTTALDVSIQAQILDLIKKLCREHNVGVILVTHDMGVIAETADRVAVMYRGQLVEIGPTEQILGDPRHAYTKSLIAAVPPSNKRIDRFPKIAYQESGSGALSNFELSEHWLGLEQQQSGTSEPILTVQDICKSFTLHSSLFSRSKETVDAIRHVSFNIRSGETFGLVGESGSGKSTIARLITGILKLTSGEIYFEGLPLHKRSLTPAEQKRRRQIQMIFQDPYSSLNPRMRVADIVAEPIYINEESPSVADVSKITRDLLNLVELESTAETKYPHEFSGGQRQRISIARALASRPRFLICDEPTSALDVSIQAQILNLLKDLQEQLGLTMLFISHDLPVIRQMCDRTGVLLLGKLVEVAPTEKIFENPEHEYTKSLISLMPKFISTLSV
ncbi:MAG: dipeptide ABC transporter ATP-binding protein [Rhizobiaceae bacterium]